MGGQLVKSIVGDDKDFVGDFASGVVLGLG